jgi:hypothetical protein
MAVSGPEYERFGGNTTSFYAEVEPDHFLVVDAGTGLRPLQHLIADRTVPQHFSIFLTHYHWDHIQGLPMFAPLYNPATRVDIWGPPLEGCDPEETLCAVMCRPWWPVALIDVPAQLRIRPLEDCVDIGPVQVTHAELNHPAGWSDIASGTTPWSSPPTRVRRCRHRRAPGKARPSRRRPHLRRQVPQRRQGLAQLGPQRLGGCGADLPCRQSGSPRAHQP